MKNLDFMRSIVGPHVSEKAARVQEASNQYVFEVSSCASKSNIKDAVEALFGVTVMAVRVANVKSKVKGFRGRLGKRKAWRKAYVRLANGQSIDLVAKT